MRWKVGDLCVVKSKRFGWSNGEIKQLSKDVATIAFLEYDGVEEINISELKLFGPSAVNKRGDLVKSKSNLDGEDYEGWKVGDFCVAHWAQDESWYNAEILFIFGANEILVRFSDYGNADFTTLEDIRPAGSPLKNKTSPSSKEGSKTEELSPRSMKRVSFALEEKNEDEKTNRIWNIGDSCVARWNEDGEWYRSEVLMITGEEVLVLFIDYGNKGVTTLKQLKSADALDKNKETQRKWKVGDLCVALWNEDQVWYNSKILEIKGEKVLVVFVEYGNEDYTTLDQLKPQGSLEENTTDSTLTKSEAKPVKWRVGDLCVAIWNEDQVWYNSQIMEINGEKVLVRFVEYGNEDYTTLHQLKPAGSLLNISDGSSQEITGQRKWNVGDLCVALWEEDQVWYNSKIVQIDGEKVLVQFIEFGNEDYTNVSQLKPPGSLENKDSSQSEDTKLEALNWKVGDFCVAKSVKYDQMYNSQIKEVYASTALLCFIEFSEKEELPFSALMPFGPFAINEEQKLIESKVSEKICINGWRDGDKCIAKWNADNALYNSKILKIFSETEVLVQFTEYGNADFTKIADLKPPGSSLVGEIENEEEKLEYEENSKSMIQSQAADYNLVKNGEKNVVLNVQQNPVKADNITVQNQDKADNLKIQNQDEADYSKIENQDKPDNLIIEKADPIKKLMVKNKKPSIENNSNEIHSDLRYQVTPLKKRVTSENKDKSESITKIVTNNAKITKMTNRAAPKPDKKSVGKRWKAGDSCVAKWKEDGVWYNVKILEIQNNKVHVVFTDFGNQDYALLEELKPPGSLDGNGNLKVMDSGQFSDLDVSYDTETNDWEVGDICQVELNVDQTWFKCKILEILFDQALVVFLDHESEHYCSLDSLKPWKEFNTEDNPTTTEKRTEIAIRDKVVGSITEKGKGEMEVVCKDSCNLNISTNSKEKMEAIILQKLESTKQSNSLVPTQNKQNSTVSLPLEKKCLSTPTTEKKFLPTPATDMKSLHISTLDKEGKKSLLTHTQTNWKAGDKAAAYWEIDQRWRHAIIHDIDGDQAFVICPDETMVKATWVKIFSLKHKSVPTEGLNLIEDEIMAIKTAQISKAKHFDTSTPLKNMNRNLSNCSDKNDEIINISQSSPESSRSEDYLLSFSELIKQSSSSIKNPSHSQGESLDISLSGYKAGTTLADYSGRILSLAMTETGSRYLQSIIPGIDQQEIRNLQMELMKSAVNAMNHPKATYVIQKLIEVADSDSMEMFVTSVTQHFNWLSCNPAGCRVVQKCLLMSSPTQQLKIIAQLENIRTLIMLLKNKYGTHVVQTCLPLMPLKMVKFVVDSLQGNMVDLGRHPHGTFFVQQLVSGEVGQQVSMDLLIEEILQNIELLAYDKFGTWLVQALLSPPPSEVVLRHLSSWLSTNLTSIYQNQHSVFLAIAVFQRLVVLAMNPPTTSQDWSSMLDHLVTSLTSFEVEGRPLLITAALHSVGHLLSREIASQVANISIMMIKNKVLFVLAKYTIVLKADTFGCIVLKALHGLL